MLEMANRKPEYKMRQPTPPFLNILCTFGFIGCFLRILMVISPPAAAVAPWYPIYLSLSTLFLILCLGGLWMMRKKAVWGISLYFVVDQLVYVVLGRWNAQALILLAAITIAGWFYYRKME